MFPHRPTQPASIQPITASQLLARRSPQHGGPSSRLHLEPSITRQSTSNLALLLPSQSAPSSAFPAATTTTSRQHGVVRGRPLPSERCRASRPLQHHGLRRRRPALRRCEELARKDQRRPVDHLHQARRHRHHLWYAWPSLSRRTLSYADRLSQVPSAAPSSSPALPLPTCARRTTIGITASVASLRAPSLVSEVRTAPLTLHIPRPLC
jgi:hypothetical protein